MPDWQAYYTFSSLKNNRMRLFISCEWNNWMYQRKTVIALFHVCVLLVIVVFWWQRDCCHTCYRPTTHVIICEVFGLSADVIACVCVKHCAVHHLQVRNFRKQCNQCWTNAFYLWHVKYSKLLFGAAALLPIHSSFLFNYLN